MRFSVTAEVDAAELFEDESADWRYCTQRATFAHVEACEFIIHCGDADYAANRILEMRAAGCSPEFIQAYRRAAESGAARVLFYA